MASRYDNRIVFKNENEHYKKFFKERSVLLIRHYNTPRISYPSQKQINNLSVVQHVWAVGDRYYKLASNYYKNPKHWWLIAWYNQAPTEGHLKIGDLVYIPMPLERALQYFGV